MPIYPDKYKITITNVKDTVNLSIDEAASDDDQFSGVVNIAMTLEQAEALWRELDSNVDQVICRKEVPAIPDNSSDFSTSS